MDKLTEEQEANLFTAVSTVNIQIAFAFDAATIEHLRTSIQNIEKQVSMYDAQAVLNRGYTPTKSRLKQEELKALKHLLAYIESAKAVDVLRQQVEREEQSMRDYEW